MTQELVAIITTLHLTLLAPPADDGPTEWLGHVTHSGSAPWVKDFDYEDPQNPPTWQGGSCRHEKSIPCQNRSNKLKYLRVLFMNEGKVAWETIKKNKQTPNCEM